MREKKNELIKIFIRRYFDCIDICKVRDSGWNEVRLRGILPPKACIEFTSCVLLTVLEPTEVEFTLFQEGQRYIAGEINLLITTDYRVTPGVYVLRVLGIR